MSCSHFAWKRTGWAMLSDPPIDIWRCESCGEEGWNRRRKPEAEQSGIRLHDGTLIEPQGYPCQARA